MRTIFLSIFLFPAFLILAGCSDFRDLAEERAYRAEKATEKQTILVGAAAPWKLISNRNHYQKGVEMALEEINTQKILGRKIEIIWRDDHASLHQGRIVAQEFSENPDIVAVLGHYESYITSYVSIVYQHYGLLMVTATSTDTSISQQHDLNLIFQNVPENSYIAGLLADFCVEQGFSRVVVLSENLGYDSELANAFENRAFQTGINVIDRRSYDSTTRELEFRRGISAWLEWKEYYEVDAIFLTGELPKAGEFIVLARKMGLDIPIIGTDRLDSPQLLELGGKHMDEVFVATFFHPDEPRKEVREFVSRFREKFGAAPDAWAAQAYDTLHVLAHGMRQAGTTNPARVAEALKSMKPYNGVTGRIKFDDKGNVVNKSLVTKIVRNGSFEYLGRINQQEAETDAK